MGLSSTPKRLGFNVEGLEFRFRASRLPAQLLRQNLEQRDEVSRVSRRPNRSRSQKKPESPNPET